MTFPYVAFGKNCKNCNKKVHNKMISDIAKITSIKKILIERQLFIFSGMLQGLTIDPRLLVEHSLFKNVSSGPAFCDKMHIVRLNMASLIIDTIRIKKKLY